MWQIIGICCTSLHNTHELSAQSATGNFDSHRCRLGSNDDFLIRNDHRSPKIPIVPFGVVEVGNVRILAFTSKIEQKRISVFGSNYETA